MAVRRALLIKDSEAIKEYTNTERDNIHKYIAHCYASANAANGGVKLNRVSSGGSLGSLIDTRMQSGESVVTTGNQDAVDDGPAEFANEATTPEPTSFTVDTFENINQTRIDPPSGFTSTSWNSWTVKPVYMESDSVIREMSFQDVLDTFIDPVIDNIVSGTTSALAGGTYFISTNSSETNCTNLGVVFIDTITDMAPATTTITAAGIGEAGTVQQGTATTEATYRLFRNDGVNITPPRPLVIDYSSNGRTNPGGLREMTNTEMVNLFCQLIRQEVFDGTGNTLTYSINGAGTAKGTSMTDTRLNGSGAHTTRGPASTGSADDYRAQEFPNGTASAVSTYTLRLDRT